VAEAGRADASERHGSTKSRRLVWFTAPPPDDKPPMKQSIVGWSVLKT
jgi:hypothetical protein